MSILKFTAIAARLTSFAMVCAFLSQPGHAPAGGGLPSYVQRGDEVEALYRGYTERLDEYRGQLAAALRQSAPELLLHLRAPDPIKSGYQILPAITLDPMPEEVSRARLVAYSWPWTKRLILRELRSVERSRAELLEIATMELGRRRFPLETLVHGLAEQSLRHRHIDAHVRYNRLWQAAIAADRSGYDRESALQRLVLERQRIDDRLRRVRASFRKPSVVFHRNGEAVRLSEIARDLQAREMLLARRIDLSVGALASPAFIRMENASGEMIFRVPVFTDIEDETFVGQVKRIVERTWRIVEPENAYRVQLDITYFAPPSLYARGSNPSPGDKIDISRHLARFPAGGAIMTTGGISTHVRDYAIVLGPHPVTPAELAHEFGHILGFRDHYIRGYRNLGRNGFQVTEVVADRADIMSSTAQGLVLSKHFSRLAECFSEQPPSAYRLQVDQTKVIFKRTTTVKLTGTADSFPN